jgi:hypothetical protein
MKKLRQLWVAGVLILVITTATFAGDITTPGITQPPPTPPTTSAITQGHIVTGSSVQNPQATGDSVADFVLNLLQTMLALF